MLRNIEKISAQIRAQSFADGVSQDEREAGSLALDELDRHRVSVEKSVAEWNESVRILQDFLNKLSDDSSESRRLFKASRAVRSA